MHFIAPRSTWGKCWYGQYRSDRSVCNAPGLVSDGVEIMHANVDEITRIWQCILRIFYLFQLYFSHKLYNSQADHPRRTSWYADLICHLEANTRMANGPHLWLQFRKFRTSFGLKI